MQKKPFSWNVRDDKGRFAPVLPEIKAMRAAAVAIEALSPRERVRVIQWLSSKYDHPGH